MIEVLAGRKHGDLGEVLVARFEAHGPLVELVDTRDPRYPVSKKWVAIISTQFGCPVGCLFCDAGGDYRGDLSAAQMLALVDHLVDRRFPGRVVPVPKWKLHLARMGEPSLNPAVPEFLEALAGRYQAAGLIPTIPTLAASAPGEWLHRVRRVKDRLYAGGRFQLQFSANSTDEEWRDRLMPVPKWPLERLAAFGREWFRPGDRKLTLNFALAEGVPFEPAEVARLFDPALFLVKLTPVNPTEAGARNGLSPRLTCADPGALSGPVAALERAGFEVLVSIGVDAENVLGSNCGQAAADLRRAAAAPALR